MPQNHHRVLIILGPTASGKSDLAVKLAQKLGGEVISADSRQVYRGLDIGSGKITRKEMKGIRHHLLDVADPRRRFTAEKYRILARNAIADIISRDKLPIICGGTGFYIDAALNEQAFPPVPPDEALRKKLSTKSLKSLLAMLKRLDRKRWSVINKNDSDKKNARRLIRAMEIAEALKRQAKERKGRRQANAVRLEKQATDIPGHKYAGPPSGNDYGNKHSDPYSASFIGIKISPDALKARIRARLLKRLRGGMIAEVRRLHEPRSARNPTGGLSWKRLDELGLEYRFVSRYLRGMLSKDEMIERLTTEIGHYAKRQMTWFRRNKDIKWILLEKRGR